MTFMKITTLVTSIAFLSGCVVYVPSSKADVHTKDSLELPAASLDKLTVNAESGSLTIIGEEGRTTISVDADIYTQEKGKESYTLTLEKSGDSAVLNSLSRPKSSMWGNSHNARIDLKVRVPKSMELDVDDGSGSTLISDISAKVVVDDGSGSLVIENINGDLRVKDGSGSLTVKHIVGNVDINDGSGSIELSDVQGNLTLDDGSGSIDARDITGSASFDDGSGDLTVRNVGGNVKVHDGSGSIDIRKAGSLTIEESGSGGLTVKEIKGGFEIDS